MTTSDIEIDLRQMIVALESSVDLVGMNDTNHSKRVAYIASQIAHKMGKDPSACQFIFEMGLLHDCGVSTQQMHACLVNHFDWEDVHIHCEIGYNLLNHLAPLKPYALPILHHHTHWSDLINSALDEQTRFYANLIFLADRVDIMATSHYETDILLARKDIIRVIESYAGSYFAPEIVEAFLEVEKIEAFWISLEQRHVARYSWDMGDLKSKKVLSIKDLKGFALIMAYIVDQKSPFTAEHSLRVGLVAKQLARLCGLSEDVCDKVEIAGFLHDIGKLHMPDAILEKKDVLTETERATMNQHSYETFEILRHIKGIEDIAIWAAYHHEEVIGTGYPFHPAKADFSTEARVIAVADIFQALAQDRPYRKGMNKKQILAILNEDAASGKLDPDIVELACKNVDHCFKLAKGEVDLEYQLGLADFEHPPV